MLARNWKRIGLIILIVACFANITAKFVKKVSFNDNVKSTVTNVVDTVDETVQNVIDTVTSENTTNQEEQDVQTTNITSNTTNTVVENTSSNVIVIQEIN